MDYQTFPIEKQGAVLYVTFDNPPINVQSIAMLDDLSVMCDKLEACKETKVVVFQSANPDFFVAHADITFRYVYQGRATR